ncbi:MAG: radical SAM protein [Oscillospiraceae bacterium]|nr:radical SAM protein [Oscillospiraceae bacterium]
MEYICNDCPRRCGAVRSDDRAGGFCASPALPRVIRAAPHLGEEPCISGSRGAGTIFFTGCNLRCVFCQNREISRGGDGRTLTVQELRDLMLRLRDQGVHNIDLVTPSHFVRAIAQALDGLDLGIPVVWNSSGYESVETLRMLEGLVQVYMPDMKYWKSEPARRYSAAADYPQIAAAAILEMFRQRGPYVLDDEGLLQSGVLIRHLILPGQDMNAMDVIDFAAEEFPQGSVLFSLMSQYTPMPGLERFPELCSPIDSETNDRLVSYMQRRGIADGYWQEPASATGEMIPDFDYTGLDIEA